MNAVDDHVGEEVVNDRVNGYLRTEQEQADGVEHRVEGEGELAHGEVAAPLAQAQTHNIQTAAAGAAGQYQTAAHARQNTAQQTAGQLVGHDGHGGDGDQTVENGVGRGADQGFYHEGAAQRFVGSQQNGDVGDIVQDAGDIMGAEIQSQSRLSQRAQQLADAHQTAGV